MSKKTDNDENFKKYQERLARLQQEGKLTSLPENISELLPDQLISYLAAEGMKLLDAEEKDKAKLKPKMPDDSTKLTNTLGMASKNPYVRARVTVLQKYSEQKRKELAEMEKTGNINNKKYQDFVAEVTKLGDTLSGQK